ncbi:hypothetical protein [Psychrobacter celer]|uniref:hypothetical protein n=1 Tax=Psychrobacter celer TaxID=306572 RepID=UPI003FD53C4A
MSVFTAKESGVRRASMVKPQKYTVNLMRMIIIYFCEGLCHNQERIAIKIRNNDKLEQRVEKM